MTRLTAKSAVAVAALSLTLSPLAARAHCDTLDGPVVKTALAALDSGDVRPVLAWVKADHEKEIRTAFVAARDARKRNPGAREKSDHLFLETVVRVHRAGEGAPFEGLKAAGEGVGPAVRAADHAIEEGNVAHVEHALTDAIRSGLHERWAALNARTRPGADVAAGREWVAAYVEYVHYVENLEKLARSASAHEHGAGHDHGAKSAAGSASNAHAH